MNAREPPPTRTLDLGPVAQAVVPGIYAWGVTVAPFAFARGAPLLARVIALGGVLALAVGPVAERRAPRFSRAASVWALVVTSALVWLLAPAGALARFEPGRAVAGMLGWALFAFASAAPAPNRDENADARIMIGSALRPRGRVRRGDRVLVGGGIVAAAALQLVGWGAVGPERALLTRLVAIASGLGVIGAATAVALARHAPPTAGGARHRLRAASPSLLALALLLAVGAVRATR